MHKKDSEKINEIKKSISDFSLDAIELTCSINDISEVIIDYCAYNLNSVTGNIGTLAEIIKQKSKDLIDMIDSKDIEISGI